MITGSASMRQVARNRSLACHPFALIIRLACAVRPTRLIGLTLAVLLIGPNGRVIAATPAPFWLTVVTHFDRPSDMSAADLAALQRLAERHPQVQWTHLFNPVAYTEATPLRDEMERLVKDQQQRGIAEIGLHLHMYRSLVESAGVPFRNTPSASARQAEGSVDETGYAVPMTAYAPQEMAALLRHAKSLFAAHQLEAPRTFCAGFYTTNRALQENLIAHGFTVSAAAFPQNDEYGQEYPPAWNSLCGWNGTISHKTRPYWVSQSSIHPDGPAPYLRHTLGPLLEVPQTTKIDWMMTADDMLAVFRTHRALARSGQATAVCLALHEVSAAEQEEKFDQVLRQIAALTAQENELQLRYVTCSTLRDEWMAADWATSLHPAFSEFTPQGLFRITSAADAESRRTALIHAIWPTGLPTDRRPHCQVVAATEPAAEQSSHKPITSSESGGTEADSGGSRGDAARPPEIRTDHLGRVEQFEMTIPVADFRATAYFMTPRYPTEPPQLALVHAGHVSEGAEHYLSGGVREVTEELLSRGMYVATLQMPLTGWNHHHRGVAARLSLRPGAGDATADPDAHSTTNGGDTIDGPADPINYDISGRTTRGHDELFDVLTPVVQHQVFAIFLEPIVQVITEFEARHALHGPTVMMGLSGGGWTTHVAAAIDTRIALSIPVAGAMPLYARHFSHASWGDAEQVYPPLFAEIDSDGDTLTDQAAGLASWLEVFALGGIGPHGPRRQIQLLNYYDSCCFGGEVYRTYDEYLRRQVAALGGNWTLQQDRTHHDHRISRAALEQIILPAIDALNVEYSTP